MRVNCPWISLNLVLHLRSPGTQLGERRRSNLYPNLVNNSQRVHPIQGRDKSQEYIAETPQGSTHQATSAEARQMGIQALFRQYIDYLEIFGLSSSLQCIDLCRFTQFLDLSIVHPKAFA